MAAMFDNVAEGYDRTNAVATMGLEKLHWRPATLAEIAPRKGLRILDLAAGTGASSIKLREAGAEVVSCDFSVGMLRVGKRRYPELDLIAGDALRLPFADGTFDVVTISWALRNVNDVTVALREMLRVTRPGGRLVVLENSHPTWKPFRVAYLEYMMRAVPVVAQGGVDEPRGLRVPGRVGPRLAGPGTAGPHHRGRRLDPRPVAQPDRWSGRHPPRGEAGLIFARKAARKSVATKGFRAGFVSKSGSSRLSDDEHS